MVTIKRLRGQEILPYIPDAARLRTEVFSEFPYLYDGDLDYEKSYLASYAESERSVFVVVLDEESVVGISTGLPLMDAEDAFQDAFGASDIDPKDVFYFGESVLKKPFRGHGMGTRFFEEREKYARELQEFKWTAFCAVERPVDHPDRPENYQPLDAFWGRRGYLKHPEIHTTFEWKEHNEAKASAKPMVFWVRPIR